MESRQVPAVDAVTAAALTLAAQVEIWAPGLAPGVGDVDGSRPVLSVTAALMTVPLAWRRSRPAPACLTVLAAGAAQSLLTVPSEGLSTLAALLLAAYSLAAGTSGLLRYAGALAVLATAAVVGEGDTEFVLLLLGAAWVSGVVLGERTGDVAALRSSHAALVRERDEAAARGAAEERTRIARELHDVVAHRVSLMVVQAQGAEAVLDVDPSRARVAMVEVQDAGRIALAELRSLLGLLRDESEGGDASRAPQPGLDDLEELLGSTQAAGVEVSLERDGTGDVPAAVGAAAYRVVQEAVTNVIKHGAGSPATVRVHVHDATVEVTVDDRGPGSHTTPLSGYGLAGMQERMAFVGGTLTAGPRAEGGFRVHAVIPLAPDRADR